MQSCPALLRALSSSASPNCADPNHYFDHPNQFIPGLSALSSSASAFSGSASPNWEVPNHYFDHPNQFIPSFNAFSVLRAPTGGTKAITFTTQTNLFLV